MKNQNNRTPVSQNTAVYPPAAPQTPERYFPAIPDAVFDDEAPGDVIHSANMANSSFDDYLQQYVETSLPPDIRSAGYMTQSDSRISLIASIAAAVFAFFGIVYYCVFHRNAVELLTAGIIAAFIYVILMRKLKKKSSLYKKINKLPDEDILFIVNSEADKMKKRSAVTRRNLLIIGGCILCTLLCFIKPHMIFEKTGDGYSLRYYTSSLIPSADVVIPDTYKGKTVTGIRGQVFQELTSIESIKLPAGLTEIRGNTFEHCIRLRRIEIPDGVIRIGGYAFSECYSLQTVKIPESVTEIGGGAFSNCPRLDSITLPAGLTEIKGNTFEECTSLTEIMIPEGVQRIGGHAFYDCSQLSSVQLPSTLQEIGSSAFRLCANLYEVTVPSDCYVNPKAFKESPTAVTYSQSNTEV